ncbi:MAG: sodium:solute symporter family protein [Planctomycetota bacterium JB042]
MQLHPVDWIVVAAYVALAIAVGVRYARRASSNVDEYFLSGRRLPWWIAGTSMVATTFAADTPLVVTGWVRDHGIWKNWLWWTFCIGGMLTAFLFARYWRRLGIMTTAELSELRYGGREAAVLRGFLGFFHAGITNILVLSWVLLAAAKISKVLFDVDENLAVAGACAVAMTYSLAAGFWGVVVTDVAQFGIAMIGAVALAVLAWQGVGGLEAVRDSIAAGDVRADVLDLLPSAPPDAAGWLDPAFWTVPISAVAVYLGVQWWATRSIEGGEYIVQRIAACRDERHGVLAQLWFNLANYALRPWPWIVVALASLVVLPTEERTAPIAGTVAAAEDGLVVVAPDPAAGGDAARVTWDASDVWSPVPTVAAGTRIAAGEVVARTDSERAYPAMMVRYLPIGLLGLVVASLLAALMSTIDTHVILASSYFVNDLYRRFVAPDRSARHYVAAGRLCGVFVMIAGALVASRADSISALFLFFLAFLGGVGPIYVLRWLWWRVRGATEIVAMLVSATTTTALTRWETTWSLGPLSPDGALTAEGRLLLVVGASSAAALLSIVLLPAPDPATLVPFYRRVRPLGAWGPVRALAPDVPVLREGRWVLAGTAGAVATAYGALFGLGHLLLGRPSAAAGALVAAVGGAFVVRRALARLASADANIGANSSPEQT